MTNVPYITLNVAMTADGKTDTIARRGALISSALDMMRVDQLRAASDAIMVGGHTLLGDDPRLTVKTESLRKARLAAGKEENPIKVGIITNADLNRNCRFLNNGPAKIVIFTTTKTAPEKIQELRDLGGNVFVTEGLRVDLEKAITQLGNLGVKELLVEGGGTLNEELLKLNLINEINIYIAPLIFGGSSAPTFASSDGFEREYAKQLKLDSIQQYDDDGLVLRYII